MLKVRKTAMGSLLPDSNSISGCIFPRRLTFESEAHLKTAAASVEDTMAPNKSPSGHEK